VSGRLAAWLRAGSRPEYAWIVFAVLNLAAMGLLIENRWSPGWETVPFHFVYVSFTILYGFRVWRNSRTVLGIVFVSVTTGGMTLIAVMAGREGWPEETEVPLMSLMFLAMVFHAQRRQQAMRVAESLANENAAALERQKVFLSDISHEMLTPITIAQGNLEVLRRSGAWSREETEEAHGIVAGELSRMSRLLQRLLLLERAAAPGHIAPVSTDVDALLREVQARWAHVDTADVVLSPGRVGVALLDRDEIVLALDALLENAVQHSEPGGRVELRASAVDRDVVIEVADRGGGIAAEKLPHVFERFYRVDRSRNRREGGAGLGLAIVDAIARAHGGTASIRSAPGAGTTVALTFPGALGAQLHPIATAAHGFDLEDAGELAT
jgi:two-component system, OmpR family, sensor kinase